MTTTHCPTDSADVARSLRRRTALLLATLLAVVLVAAACSDNGDDAGTDDPPTATQPDAGGAYGGESDAAEPDEPADSTDGATVEATDFQFRPSTLAVEVGTEVTWSNGDDFAHTATADEGEFDVEIGGGSSGSHTFEEPGTHSYTCSIHPSMTGTIEVG